MTNPTDAHFGTALEAARPILTSHARRLTRDPDRANDLTQDTLLRAWNARAKFEAGSNLKAWLFTIQRNLFLSGVRRSRREVSLEIGHESKMSVQPQQESHLAVVEVAVAWKCLSLRQQHLLWRLVLEGRSIEDVATADSVATGTIKSRAARARAALRNHLGSGISIASALAPRPASPAFLPVTSAVNAPAPPPGRTDEDECQVQLLSAWRERRAAERAKRGPYNDVPAVACEQG